MTLSAESCIPCKHGDGALAPQEIMALRVSVPHWRLVENRSAIEREWVFKNFALALAFVNEVGALAEAEDHHPDISVGWGYARLRISTHRARGLTRNDFVLAAKIDELGA